MPDIDGSLTAIALDAGHRVGMAVATRPAGAGEPPGTYGQRCLAASRYLAPRHGAVAGRSAAWLLGVRLAGPADPIEVLTPWRARSGPVEGLRIHVGHLSDEEVEVVGGIRRTRAARTCWDLAQWLPAPDAVAYLDAMLARRLVSREQLAGYARRRAGRRGWRRLLRAVLLTDPDAGSAGESRARVRSVLAGRRPASVTTAPVFRLYRSRTGIEYDE